jgi:hypothetical protein
MAQIVFILHLFVSVSIMHIRLCKLLRFGFDFLPPKKVPPRTANASENIYDLGTKSLTLNKSFFFVDSEPELGP